MDQLNNRKQISSARVRLNPSESTNSNELSKNCCPICFNELLDVAAYQACGHILCFDCSVRNRVLCDKKECPVCRAESSQVVLAGHRSSSAEDNGDRFNSVLAVGKNRGDDFYGFIFENIGIERAYRKILTHACRFCDRKFEVFDELVRHCRDRHEQHYCTVCVRTLMLFTWEHKLYSYDELLRHMEEGDPNDKNIPPHPQCQLCHFRAFDKDDLFKHSKHRHHLCWICERHFNKLLFFGSFMDLANHMNDHHHVCKSCSKPDEARLVAFPNQDGLEIHMAADHSDGTIRPEMLFNFQSRGGQRGGGRQNRNQADEENAENVRPLSPISQSFNMDATQFPALSAGESVVLTSDSNQKHPAGYKKISDNFHAKQPDSLNNFTNKPRYAPPKLSEDNFPSLGGGPSTSAAMKGKPASQPQSLWSSGPKIAAPPPFSRKLTVDKPKVEGSMQMLEKVAKGMDSKKFTIQEESFPALSGPPPPAVAKLNRDWVVVPVKSKSKLPNKPAEALPSSMSQQSSNIRWDVLAMSPESSRKSSVTRPKVDDMESTPKPSNRFGSHKAEMDPIDSENFPSLAAPSGNALSNWFGQNAKNHKPKSQRLTGVAEKKKTGNCPESQSAILARTLFQPPQIFRETLEEEDDKVERTVPIVSLPVIPPRSFSMKKEEFPSLTGSKDNTPMKPVNEAVKPDRIKKQKEVKSQWGNTVIQYETVFQFIPPPNCEERLNDLRTKVEPVDIKGTWKSLDDFQKELLNEQISPLEFWMECRRILGKKFGQLMPEVLLLLPSLSVQGEVYEVAKVPIYGDQAVIKNLWRCSVCGQIVRNGDEKTYHIAFHKA